MTPAKYELIDAEKAHHAIARADGANPLGRVAWRNLTFGPPGLRNWSYAPVISRRSRAMIGSMLCRS